MAWLLFILFLFFAWRAAAYFRQGRPQPAILALGACALFLAGIFTNYLILQRQAAEPAVAATVAPAALAEAPPPSTPPEPAPVADDPAALDSFYGETEASLDEGPVEEPPTSEMDGE
jgi:hypothetical protein